MKKVGSFKNLGSGFLQGILDGLGIKDFLDEKQKELDISYELSEIFYLLVYSQIIDPLSIQGSCKESHYFFGDSYPWYDWYRALDYFALFSEELQEKVISKIEDEVNTKYFCSIGRI